MGLIPTVTCRRCHREYPALRSKCPYCGTRKGKPTPRPKAEATPKEGHRSTQQPRRRPAPPVRGANPNAKIQMILGLVILGAILAGVIALISLNTGEETLPTATPSPTPSSSITPSTPTPDATVTPSPEPSFEVTSITFTSNGAALPFGDQFTMSGAGSSIQLGATVYPMNPNAEVVWASDNEAIVTVNSTGLVTATGTGWANITATCGNCTATCKVWVQ